VQGQGGWYAEGKRADLKAIYKNLDAIAKDPEPYLLEVAPKDKRLTITD
jgi:hypothetical protein